MKSIVEKWIKFAGNDMATAMLLFTHGKKMGFAYQAAVFHCHQAIEKMLKAVLINQDKEGPKIHNLVRLLALTGIKINKKINDSIENISPHYLPPRYPDMEFKSTFPFSYNSKSTERVLSATKKIILCLKKEIM